ncbi:zinc metalloprotease HtpX [Candidatus Dependentiae bacterium]|nr:zinc metalloprotease HtpX [Candidatus Dependentiae bacterium]
MWGNRLKTVILLASLSGLLLLLGAIFGGQQGITVAFVMSLMMNFIAYFFSDRIVLRMYGAKPLDEAQYGWIYDMVRELCRQARIPMPKLWLIDTSVANAFATGRSPSHASVAVTTGILEILDKNELRGVLAHEISHIANRDILINTIAATLATAIGYIANMIQHAAFYRTTSSDNKKNGTLTIIGALVISILMPIAATLIQLAITRSREYLADETGAHVCKDPLALADALQKLNDHVHVSHFKKDDSAKASTAHMFIVNPFTPGMLATLFSTHPPMEARIMRLRKIYEEMS